MSHPPAASESPGVAPSPVSPKRYPSLGMRESRSVAGEAVRSPGDRPPAADQVKWRAAPLPPVQASRGLGRTQAEALAAVCSVTGPVVRSFASLTGSPELVLLVGLAASLLLGRVAARHWILRLSIALGAGVVLSPSEGPVIAIWLSAGLILSDWVIRSRRLARWIPEAGFGAVAPVLVLMGVAAWRGRELTDTVDAILPLVFVGLALVTAGLHCWKPSQLDRLARVVGQGAGRFLLAVSFGLIGVLLVVPSRLVRRMSGHDPMVNSTERTAWTPRSRLPRAAERPWAADAAVPARSGVGARWARPMAAALVAVLVVSAVLALRDSPSDAPVVAFSNDEEPAWAAEISGEIPAAHADDDWYPDYREDIHWILNEAVAYRPLHPHRIADVRTRYINVSDGRRHSWTPPPCECRRLKVWVYGGSTTFGLGQRDEHTIPSELARAAHAAGLTVDVWNRGVPGHLHFNEAQRFLWDLTVDDPPDLVVFYDGVNEVWSARYLSDRGDVRDPVDPQTEDLARSFFSRDPLPPPRGGRLVPVTTVPELDLAAVGDLAGRRYARSLEMSRDIAAANRIPVAWFWQPSRYARDLIEGEPYGDLADELEHRSMYRRAGQRVPPEVVNLESVFVDDEEPIFTDDVHHNERGARIIGAAMFEHLEDELRRLSALPAPAP